MLAACCSLCFWEAAAGRVIHLFLRLGVMRISNEEKECFLIKVFYLQTSRCSQFPTNILIS